MVYFKAEFKVGVKNLYNLIVVIFDNIELSVSSIFPVNSECLKIPVKFCKAEALWLEIVLNTFVWRVITSFVVWAELYLKLVSVVI